MLVNRAHPTTPRPGDVPYTCADVSKAERLLGYSQVKCRSRKVSGEQLNGTKLPTNPSCPETKPVPWAGPSLVNLREQAESN
jgi:hypothetical protein